MNIDIETLEKAFQAILNYQKESGVKSIEVDKDFYWDISQNERYDPYTDPQDFSLGQLSSDWEHMQKVAEGSEDPMTYSLVWLGKYGLAWYSDLILPVIIDEPKDLLVWIGVDQQLVGIDKSRGNIVVSLQLFYIFVDMLTNNSMLFVLTELELMIFNSNGSLSQIKDLPEISLGLSVYNDMLSIDLIDGEILNINLKDL